MRSTTARFNTQFSIHSLKNRLKIVIEVNPEMSERV